MDTRRETNVTITGYDDATSAPTDARSTSNAPSTRHPPKVNATPLLGGVLAKRLARNELQPKAP